MKVILAALASVLAVALVVAFKGILSSSIATAEVQAAPQSASVAIVGPITLGELFRNRSGKKEDTKKMKFGGWPDESDIINAMNKTNLWILDSKSLNNGTWKLDFKDRPNILLEGPLCFDLKGKSGSTFTISIKEVAARDASFGDGNKTRRLRVVIRTDSSPYDTNYSTNATGLNFFSNHIIWDLDGTVTLNCTKP